MENLNIEKFNPTKNELLELADQGRKLVINGTKDKEGYNLVHEHRMKLKEARVKITKTGKEAREEALAYQRKVIEYEKELIAIIEPEEKALKAKQDAIDEAIEKEKRVAGLPERREKMASIGLITTDEALLEMDDTEFQEHFNREHSNYLKFQEEKIRKEQEAKAAELRAQQDKIDAERRAIEEEKLAEQRRKDQEIADAKRKEEEAKRLEEERKAAAERAVQEERDRVEREKREAEQAEADRIAKEKKEQEELESRKKYQNFLTKHGYTEKTKDEFVIKHTPTSAILYKKVGELKI